MSGADDAGGFFDALGRFVERRRAVVFALALVSLAACAWPLLHARFSSDLTDLLPPDSRAANAFRHYRERFEQGDQLLVIAVADAKAQATRPTPAQWIASLRERLAPRPELLRLEGGPLEAMNDFVAHVLPSAGFAWLTADEAAAVRDRVSPAGMEQALRRSLALLERSPGLEMSELVRRDPLCLRDLLAARAARLFGEGAPQFSDESFALLSIVGRRPAQDLEESHKIVDAVDREIAALGRPANLRILRTGGYAMAVEDEAEVRGNLEGTGVSSFVVVALIQLAAYRSVRRLFAANITLLIGITWAYALFVALRGGITVLTAAGASMLVGLADDYGDYLYSEMLRAQMEGATPAQSLRLMLSRGGLRVTVGALTSSGCFLAFCMTGFRGLADLGLLSGLGLFTCVCAYLTIFPALLRGDRPKVRRTFVAAFSEALCVPPIRWPRATLVAAGAVTLVSAGVLVLKGVPSFVSDMHALHTSESPSMQALIELDRLVDRPLVPWIILAEGKSADELSERFAALAPKLQPLVDDHTLVSFEPPTLALPPRRDQLVAFAALRGLDAEKVAATFMAQGAELGFTDDALRPTADLLRDNLARAAQQRCVTLEELHALGAGALADSFFRARDGVVTAVGLVFAKGGLFGDEGQQESLTRLSKELEKEPGFALSGFQVVAAELAARVHHDFRGVTFIATAVVVGLVLLGARSLSATFLALFPVALAFVWLFAAMVLLGITLNVFNIVLLPMLVGLGAVYGVQMVFDARQTGDVGVSLGAVMLPMFVSMATTVAGFGALMAVKNPGVQSMGALSATGVLLTMVATIVVLVPAMRLMERQRARSRVAEVETAGW
jgi:hypothetical protein